MAIGLAIGLATGRALFKLWLFLQNSGVFSAGNVLATAVDNGHRTLILGAWGCGVFRNDPELVADAFATWLASDRFLGCFDKVVFAVYDKSKGKQTFKAFQDSFKDKKGI